MKRKNKLLGALLLGAVGFCICGLQCGLTVRTYTVYAPQLKNGDGARIVLLSDLHSYVYGQDQAPLLEAIRQASPDLITLCGDIVDDRAPVYGAGLLLSQLAEIAPCYYVSGNHEFWCDDPEAVFTRIEDYGIRVLRNEWETLELGGDTYVLCGVDDPAATGDGTPHAYGDRARYLQTLRSFRDLPQGYRILLAHRPEFIEQYTDFDLSLSGHAHGGQWRIPYLMNGLIAPNQGFFPQYAGGRYQRSGLTAIVGRGLVRDWKPRFFNPPELVIVQLRPNSDG